MVDRGQREERVNPLEAKAKAKAFVQRGCWDQHALEANLAILKSDPCDVGALCRAGRCYHELGDYGPAIQMYVRAAECCTNEAMSEKILRTISELTVEEGKAEQRDAKERKLRRRLEGITDPQEMIHQGSKMRDKERLDLAAMLHTRAILASEDDPTRVHALEAYAADLRQLNKPKKAAAAVVHALALDSSPETNMPAYTILVASLCDLGRNSEAADIAEIVFLVSPNDHFLREASRRAFREAASDRELADSPAEAQARIKGLERQATFFADSKMIRQLEKLVEKVAAVVGAGSLEEFLDQLRA